MTVRIDLAELVGKEGVVLAGMERGVAARDMFVLDKLDSGSEDVVIIAPGNLEAISPSFVQGFLAGSLKHLGEDGLRAKYRFDLNELLLEDIAGGIKRLLMKRKIAALTKFGRSSSTSVWSDPSLYISIFACGDIATAIRALAQEDGE